MVSSSVETGLRLERWFEYHVVSQSDVERQLHDCLPARQSFLAVLAIENDEYVYIGVFRRLASGNASIQDDLVNAIAESVPNGFGKLPERALALLRG